MKKIVKIFFFVFLFLHVFLYVGFVVYTAPKSNKKVLKAFSNSYVTPSLTQQKYKGFSYRKISVINDANLPTLVFVHGTIGSLSNFSEYLSDSLLQSKVNMISYDRIGYNYKDKNVTQESIAFEVGLLESVTKDIDKSKMILVGYSYGGPIALAFKQKIIKTLLLAPALYGEYEVMPWKLNFYKCSLTRWLVPFIWKQAAKEKLSHKKDLQNFQEDWRDNPNEVLGIHGKKDGVVPYENSIMLKEEFPEDRFELILIEEASHSLIRSDFKLIKQQLLTVLD